MAFARRRPLSLDHLFAAPLVRETAVLVRDESDPCVTAVKQQNYARERDVITSTLAKAKRGILFRSKVASEHNFLISLTGCRVLHFTWNGDGDQQQVMFEDKRGYASVLTEEWFQSVCDRRRETLPEVVVLTAASAKLVAGAFIRAGISNVVAVETSGENVLLEDFVCAFYTNLAQGCTLRHSFESGVRSLPNSERSRVVLLPEHREHLVSPFDDAECTSFINHSLHWPRMPCKAGPANFRGREAKVQEVYMHMVQHIKVITIKGKPGIGKTQVALKACAYAWERRLFGNIFFVSLQDQQTGAPITALKDVAARIAHAIGISQQQIQEHAEGFLGCIQQKCGFSEDDLLLVLDGCSSSFVHENNERIKLSSVVEQLCQRVSKLQYIVTVVNQVGITKEKIVNIGRLSDVTAAELFVASAPREVTVNELRGGLDVSGPQIQDAECMRLFAGSDIMSALGGHPGAIMAASNMLKEHHLLRHEDEYLRTISAQLERYETLEGEFARQLRECPQTQSDFGWIERIWGGRPARQNIVRRPPGPGRRRENPRTAIPRPTDPETVPVNPATGDQSSGEFWWRRAVEKHVGAAGALSQAVIPWEALCTHSLGEYFTQVLGDEGRHRPLRDEEFHTLGHNKDIWQPHLTPGRRPGEIVDQQGFLGSFWPWFKAATRLLKRTGYWGCRRYPVICGLTTTSNDGKKLLQGRPGGTFLLRVSSVPGALVVMYVKHHQQVESILVKDPNENGKFEMEYKTPTGTEKMRASLADLILFIDRWTHLFPDTPKREALRSAR